MTILTSTKLLSRIRSRGQISTDQAGMTDTDLLELASDELNAKLVPNVLKVHEDFLLHTDNKAVAANTSSVRFPERCFGQGLRHLYWVDGGGNKIVLEKYEHEDRESMPTTPGAVPEGFIVEGSYILLFPTPSAAGTLVMTYAFRPNEIVTESTTRPITAVDVNTRTVTFSSMPTVFTFASKYDVVSHRSGNEILKFSLTPSNISGSTITFNESIDNVEIGDYVALEKQAPVAMIPEECHLLLVEFCVARLASSRGHAEQAKLAYTNIKYLIEQLPSILDNRIDSKPVTLGGSNPFFPTWR